MRDQQPARHLCATCTHAVGLACSVVAPASKRLARREVVIACGSYAGTDGRRELMEVEDGSSRR